MKRLECGVSWILLAAILVSASPAFATTQTKTNFAEWQAALSNIYTYQSFDTLTAQNYTSSAGLLVANPTPGNGMGDVRLIAFYGTNHAYSTTLQVYDEYSATSKYWGGTGFTPRIVRGQTYTSGVETGLRILFTNTSIYAVFLDVMIGTNPDGGSGSASLTASTGPVTTVTTSPRPTRSYIGVLSDVPITYLDVLNVTSPGTSTYAIIDNVYYSTQQPADHTPEPTTLLLIGSGLVAFRIMRRLEQRRVSSTSPGW